MGKSKQNTIGGALNYVVNVDIDGHRLMSNNIISVIVREWAFDILPRLELIVNDDGILTETYPLHDGSIITVEFGKNNDKVLTKLDFTLLFYTAGSMSGNKFMQIMMIGALKIDGFYKPFNRCFKNKNSFDVLYQMIVKEGGKTLNKDSQMSTQDLMNWLQINQNNLDMVKHVLKRAYKPNDPVFLFADSTGEFNYTSLNIELSKETESISKFNIQKYSYDNFKDDEDYKNLWYNSYNLFNFDSYTNQIKNYGVKYKYYDTNSGLADKKYSDNTHQLSALSSKLKDSLNDYSLYTDFGVNHNENTHDHYYDAIVQNDYLKNNFFGGNIVELNINSVCHPRLMSKTNIDIPSLIGPGSNHVLSGEYLIVGKIHEIHKVNGVYGLRIACARNGNNKSPFETSETSE
jgi:hypothetical protein